MENSINPILHRLPMALLPIAQRTRLHTRIHQRRECVVIGEEAISEHLEVDGDRPGGVGALREGLDDGVDAEGVRGVNVVEDEEGVGDVAGVCDELEGAASGEGGLEEAGDDDLGMDLEEFSHVVA